MKHVFRSACLFAGAGAMAYGAKEASQRFREHGASFELCGAYDYDAYACQAYEYLNDSPCAQLDAATITLEQIRKLFGEKPPDAAWISAPCQGACKMLPEAKAATPKYVAMNDLSLRGVQTLLDAYPDDPIPLIFFENVPNITTRAKQMLRDLRKLAKSRGYVQHEGYHEARHLGDLAQRRKRWFAVWRHPSKVPVFLYMPPHKAGKVCGDVLGPLPLPNDPRGGPMHRLSNTSMINLLRLWAIPAGGDWRDLIQDDVPRRERFRRQHIERWDDPSVTIGGPGSNGACAVQDPRPAGGVDLLGGKAPTQEQLERWEQEGVHADGAVHFFKGKHGVRPWSKPARTVIAGPGNDATADPRVLLQPQAGNGRMHWGKYVVVPMNGTAPCVTTALRVGSGAPSIADDRVDLSTGPQFNRRWGVLSPGEPSDTVTTAGRPQCGAFSYAAPAPEPVDLVPKQKCYDAGYGVLAKGQPSRTIATKADPGCGAYAIADEVPAPLQLELGCAPHAGAYGVTGFDQEQATITAHHKVDNRPAAVADPRPTPAYVVLSHEETKRIVDGEVRVPFAIVDQENPGEALAIVDDLEKPPYRWVETKPKTKRGKPKRKKETVALVLISADGTWHRPLTTLELAVLQSFPAVHNGKPLDFGGGSTAQRTVIGNAVPCKVAKAIAEQMLLSLVVAATVGFTLGDPGTPVWVKNVRALERQLQREGYVVVKGRGTLNFTTGEMLDDGFARWRAAKPKKKARHRARTLPRAIPRPVHVAPAHAYA